MFALKQQQSAPLKKNKYQSQPTGKSCVTSINLLKLAYAGAVHS